jgi:hypothetical protein
MACINARIKAIAVETPQTIMVSLPRDFIIDPRN